MAFHRYISRGDSNVSYLFFQWDGTNQSDVKDFLALYRPNSTWTVDFEGDGNRYPMFYRQGVNKGGPAPYDWVQCIPWGDFSEPALQSDLSFHQSYMIALP